MIREIKLVRGKWWSIKEFGEKIVVKDKGKGKLKLIFIKIYL